MKICVIGGAGYIGSHTVYELIRDHHEVVVIDNLSTGKKESVHRDAKLYVGDITRIDDLKEIFSIECASKPFDAVMDFAAKIIVSESVEQPLLYYHNNVEGVRIILEVMAQFSIKNIIFSSTAAVYGDVTKELCEEDDVLCPMSPYGETKLAAEKMIQWVAKTYSMNYCIFRYFNVAGADESLEIGLLRDNLTHIVPITVQTALGLRTSMVVYGNDYPTFDGTCIRDYIHVSDLATAHVLGAAYVIKNNRSLLLNLGSNHGFSVMEVIHEVEKFYPVAYSFGPRRAGDPAKLIASSSRAKEILGWAPTRTLSDIIKSDIEFRLKNEFHQN